MGSSLALAAAAKGLSAVPSQELPYNGTYWLVTREGGFLIPFPGLPDLAENTPVFSLGCPGQFLVDATDGVAPQPNWRQAQRGVTAATLLDQQSKAVLDLITQVQAAYAAELAATKPKSKAGLMSRMDAGPPVPGDGTGDTNVIIPPEFDGSGSGFGSNDLWLQIFMTNRALARLLINTPDTNGIYDVYATSNLNLLVPGLNLTNWTPIMRTTFTQTNLLVTNLWPDQGFFRLGTMLDSDSDGLPDAFELLVSHTNPNLRDSNGNGILDGDELSPAGLPWRLEQVRRSAAVVYASAPVATEGGACGLFTVYLASPAPAGGMTVQYRLGGTAVLNTDYTLSPAANSLFVPAGQPSASILVCASNNTTYSDLDRYAEITLTNATAGLVDSSPARVDIVDNDPPPIRAFALPNWVREPSSTYGTNTAAFYFVRDGDATNAVTLNFSLSGSAVANVNYTALPTSVTFPANVRTNLLTVVPLVDTNTATDRVLTLTLTTATGYQMDTTANAATITIANVSTPQTAVVQVTATDDDAREAGLDPGVFTFTRTGATTDALRVAYRIFGTALMGSTNSPRDYVGLPGYADFLPGAGSTNVPVIPLDDNVSEPMKTIVVTLAAGDYQIGSNHTATVYLDDNDTTSWTAQVVRHGIYDVSPFRQRPAYVQLTRSGSALAAATVTWKLSYNLADNKIISSNVTGNVAVNTFVWAARQTVANVMLQTTWQSYSTNTMPATLVLSNALGQQTLTLPYHPASHLVTVESATPPAAVVTEGTTVTGALIFRRPYADTNPFTAYFAATGSATYGATYTNHTKNPMEVGFAPSQTSVSVNVQAFANSLTNGWRTGVITFDPTHAAAQVSEAAQDHTFVRIQDAQVSTPTGDTDLDEDGLSDGDELSHAGLDPLTPNDPYTDDDLDGLGLFEELELGTDPNVADAPPVFPSAEESDYVPLILRLGASGKLGTSANCAQCHEVGVRAGPHTRTSPRVTWEVSNNSVDHVIRFLRGTNYPVHLLCNPFAKVLPSSLTNSVSPHYTARYTAQFFQDTNAPYPFLTDTNQLFGVSKPMVAEALAKTATLYVPDMIIAADNDRDGLITFSNRTDRTYPTNPFTFWINDDADSGSDDAAVDLEPNPSNLNSVTAAIDNLRDLEDFARLQFKIEGLPAAFATNGNLLTKVYLTNLSGAPSLRLFRAVDNTGSLGYLTNITTATAQVATTALGVLSNGTALTLPSANWFTTTSNSLLLPMIFEGITTGRCVITFGFASNTGPALALSRPFYLDLKPVTQLYEHWTVGDNTNTDWTQIPPIPTRTADSAIFNDPKTTNGLDYILFVHGWRMAPWERRAFASTGFKRLWHLGYQGRYGLFSWPTDNTGTSFWDMSNPITGLTNRQNYDRSEQRAWNSAKGLEYLLRELNKEQTYRVPLLAHSMGNVTASEALRLYAGETNLPLIHTYIASQAASVAHAYDAVNPEVRIQIFFPYYFRVPEMYAAFPRGTNNISRPYFIGMTNALSKTGAGAARLFNFHNKDDYALNSTVSWPVNQSLKPDDGWSALFHGTNTDYTFFDHNTQLYLDAHKLDQVFDIYAYIAQARSKALGCAEDPTHHIQGDIGGAVNLNLAPFNYGNNTYEHSAEFNSINMNRRSYWWQVLSTFSITNNLPNL